MEQGEHKYQTCAHARPLAPRRTFLSGLCHFYPVKATCPNRSPAGRAHDWHLAGHEMERCEDCTRYREECNSHE